MLHQFKNAYPVLFKALENNNPDQVLNIVTQQTNFDVNFQDNDGKTTLHLASYYNNSEMCIQGLINKNAKIDLQDNEGNTPLHNAAMMGNYTAIIYLLRAGAKRSLTNNQGATAEVAALQNGRFQIAEVISNFGKEELLEPVAAPVANKEPPEEYLCPISFMLMKEPVITPDGITYDKESIVDSIKKYGNDPQTGKTLNIDQLIPNRGLKSLIEKWLKKREEQSKVGAKRSIHLL